MSLFFYVYVCVCEFVSYIFIISIRLFVVSFVLFCWFFFFFCTFSLSTLLFYVSLLFCYAFFLGHIFYLCVCLLPSIVAFCAIQKKIEVDLIFILMIAFWICIEREQAVKFSSFLLLLMIYTDMSCHHSPPAAGMRQYKIE